MVSKFAFNFDDVCLNSACISLLLLGGFLQRFEIDQILRFSK